jgi:hypothetical protein
MRFAFIGLLAACALMAAAPASAQSRSGEVTTRSQRPRVVIQPRRVQLSPNARRECRAQLVQEVRASGTYVVPHMQCWWE